MRCYICDNEDESITFDRVDGRFTPCRPCQDAIFDCLVTYDEEENDDSGEADLDYA